ncbi:polymer-forming cytoskeletal protein [Thermospira aquatica]|uniref:Polymer-forming cytoskeletal protein n=2 Tax=Thermospira aquatica TaxID=2828656 RepID=A0AAX3BD95_9SPIR|nr:polymer-forming cytoskeletal protein [Thermospira aquatica]
MFINGTLQIDGRFEGTLLMVDQIYIGPNARVKANLEGSNVVIEGVVIGNIKARNRVILMPTARVLGDIRTPEIMIQNGVMLEGNLHIASKPDTAIREIILDLYKKHD